jgi:hypothetical protein
MEKSGLPKYTQSGGASSFARESGRERRNVRRAPGPFCRWDREESSASHRAMQNPDRLHHVRGVLEPWLPDRYSVHVRLPDRILHSCELRRPPNTALLTARLPIRTYRCNRTHKRINQCHIMTSSKHGKIRPTETHSVPRSKQLCPRIRPGTSNF